MTIGDLVQVPARGCYFDGPQRLIPSRAKNPLSCFGFVDSLLQAHPKILEGLYSREVDARLGHPGIIQMQMRVVESWHDEVPAQVDDLRLRPLELLHIRGLADGLDAVSAHCNRVLADNRTEERIRHNARVDVGMDKDDIRLLRRRASLPLWQSLHAERSDSERQTAPTA